MSACFQAPSAYTSQSVSVRGQEPPTRELIKLKLEVNKLQTAKLCQKDSHIVPLLREVTSSHSKSILTSGLPFIQQGSPTF
jgi:hypothetical protein